MKSIEETRSIQEYLFCWSAEHESIKRELFLLWRKNLENILNNNIFLSYPQVIWNFKKRGEGPPVGFSRISFWVSLSPFSLFFFRLHSSYLHLSLSSFHAKTCQKRVHSLSCCILVNKTRVPLSHAFSCYSSYTHSSSEARISFPPLTVHDLHKVNVLRLINDAIESDQI